MASTAKQIFGKLIFPLLDGHDLITNRKSPDGSRFEPIVHLISQDFPNSTGPTVNANARNQDP